MTGISKIFIIAGMIFMLLVLHGCSNEEPIDDSQNVGQVALSLLPQITSDIIVTSRAPIYGTNFPAGSNGAAVTYDLGTWICKHEESPSEFTPEKGGYNHLLTRLTVSGSENNIKRETIFHYKDHAATTLNVAKNKPIDIYSYYPMLTTSSIDYDNLRPDEVPFTTGESDWMWGKKSIEASQLTDSVTDIKVSYSHAMTCIRIYIKALYSSSTVNSITLNNLQGGLYRKGLLNIAKKELVLSEADEADNLTISYNRVIGTSETAFYIIMPPVDNFSEGDMSMTFRIGNNTVPNTFTIPTQMSNGQKVNGFEQGKCYTYRLTVDNTISFSAIEVDESGIWKENEYNFEL